jgi:hypothetical protein
MGLLPDRLRAVDRSLLVVGFGAFAGPIGTGVLLVICGSLA